MDDLPRHPPDLRRRRDGRYVERKKDASGDLVDLRQEDGVHLSQPGATQLARVMLGLIDEEIQAGRAAASTESTTADAGG